MRPTAVKGSSPLRVEQIKARVRLILAECCSEQPLEADSQVIEYSGHLVEPQPSTCQIQVYGNQMDPNYIQSIEEQEGQLTITQQYKESEQSQENRISRGKNSEQVNSEITSLQCFWAKEHVFQLTPLFARRETQGRGKKLLSRALLQVSLPYRSLGIGLLDLLLQAGVVRYYLSHQLLIKQKDTACEVVFVLLGRLASVELKNSLRLIAFGGSCLFQELVLQGRQSCRSSLTMRAEVQSVVLKVGRSKVANLMSRSPQLRQFLQQSLLERVAVYGRQMSLLK